jgi:hypothetical protein
MNMKNIKYYSLSIAIILLLSACSDFLDEKYHGKKFPGTYPANEDNLETMVTAMYGMANQIYFKMGVNGPCYGGDDVTTLPGATKAQYLEYDLFSVQDNNAEISGPWNYCYSLIKQANDIINNIDNIESTSLTAEQLKNITDRALGQARFMRAMAYFRLVRFYGQVPLITTVDIDYEAQKASFETIYNFIVEDLKVAEEKLPSVFSEGKNLTTLESSTSHTRITSGAAKSLLASVYLTMAGYPLKDNSMYALAAAKAKEVIDNETTYGYTLLPIDQLWKWENGWKDKANTEGVYTLFFNTWSDWLGEGANGNFLAMSLTISEMSGWNEAFAELTFFNEFPEGQRKDATFITEVVTDNGASVKSWTEFECKRPGYKKYVEMEGIDWLNMGNYIDWWNNRSIPVIRYAEVLLIYAEAQAMADGTPNAMAYKCLNRVRERANGGIADDAPSGLGGAAFRDLVITERKWEFAGMEPNSRWFDMQRTETVASATAKRDADDVSIIGKPDDTTHDYYFVPIPKDDKQINPNL